MESKLLPLPIPHCTYADHSYPAFKPQQMEAYARANLAPLQAENERLRAEIEALQEQLEWTVKQNDMLLDEGRKLTDRAERLALIDGQAQPFNGELRPDDLAVESWPPQTGLLLGLPRGIKVTHKPTGTVVTCDTERSQHANRDRAMAMLRAKLQPTKDKGVQSDRT